MLELYQAEGCPHSAEVRRKLSDLGVSYVIHNPRLPGDEGGDVLNEETHEAMVGIGGKDQIPFLVDHRSGKRLYETEAIIGYLEDSYSQNRR